MPKVQYLSKRLGKSSLAVIDQANAIIAEYVRQGYDLTLRQLYYQFVARGLIPNTMKDYKRLGSIINDGRLAGLVDWTHITDRTRNLHRLSHWTSPDEIIKASAEQFRHDLFRTQNMRIEIWVEKEALAGVFETIGDELRLPVFACRGYVSQSEMWAAGMRHRGIQRDGQDVTVLHFGDHDPSGIDMTRDIEERLALFGSRAQVLRLALNMAQVEEHSPPPNPAKQTDSRFAEYEANHGDESWELDALEPAILAGLVREYVHQHLDQDEWEEAERQEEEARRLLTAVSDGWEAITKDL